MKVESADTERRASPRRRRSPPVEPTPAAGDGERPVAAKNAALAAGTPADAEPGSGTGGVASSTPGAAAP